MAEQKGRSAQTVEERKKKLEKIKDSGIYPFGYRYERSHEIDQILKRFGGLKEGDKAGKERVRICGRIRSIRQHGKTTFMDLQDFSGKIQAFLRVNELGDKYGMIENLDTGDFIGVEGSPFKTQRGELSIWANNLEFLSKAIRTLPSEWFGFKDVETRYRQRYTDLLMNPKVAETFMLRSRIVDSFRNFLKKKGFIEVETPVLQPVAGGATARPFITHHNALGIDMYMRIAPELYLKRLIVGGFEKVFEIGPDFRNEGIDTRHNPEFTMLEFYWAYADYRDNMKLTEEILSVVIKEVLGTAEIEYQGQKISFMPPFRKITMKDAVKEYAKIDPDKKSAKEMIEFAKKKGVDIDSNTTKGEIIGVLFEEFCEKNLIQPTFVIDHPFELCPLAKRHRDNPELIERFEMFVAGRELINAYSEINDPFEQNRRFTEQVEKKKKGDDKAHMMDKDFIRALEYGMPPTTGWGIGIDRFVMFLTDSASIRDVILFPTLRPEKDIELFSRTKIKKKG